MKKIGLLPLIILAIILGIVAGNVFSEGLVRVFITFNSVFSQFLGFMIPLIIIGLVTPAIADIGDGAGKMLWIARFWSTSMGNYSTRIVHICTGTFLSSLRKQKRHLSQRLPEKSSINIHNCGIGMSVTLWLRWLMRE